eukprot:1144425-Pelagomonas_calceolata.AAC.2
MAARSIRVINSKQRWKTYWTYWHVLIIPEGIADLYVGKLGGWDVSFRANSGVWGSGLYGKLQPLPAIV